MPTALTAATLKAAFRDSKEGVTRDTTDAKVSGLVLRVKPNAGVRWNYRCRFRDGFKRFDLGPAVEGDDDFNGLSLRTARERATRMGEMVRRGQDPAPFLRALAGGVSVETQHRIDADAKVSWTWEKAKAEFLADVERANRADTLRDYRGKLQPKELQVFDGKFVNRITRNQMAKAIAGIQERGKPAMAAGVCRVVRRMFSWLAEPVRQDETLVAEGVMLKLSPPKPDNDDDKGDKSIDEEIETGDVPPEIEIGRALAIARLGVFDERISLGLQLLIGTCQRRRTVTGAHRNRFKVYKDANREQMWFVPPYFRKSGSKRGRKSHLVPAVGFVADALDRLFRLSDFPGDKGWLFPVGKTARANREHAAADLLNDYLTMMPGVDWTPHQIRYAFATYGERYLGFAKSEARLILDHMEGVDPEDVTGMFYSADPGVARKRQMMTLWTDWCEAQAEKAIEEDPEFLDREHLLKAMFIERYGQERFDRRVAYRAARKWPLWGPDEAIVAEDLQQAAE